MTPSPSASRGGGLAPWWPTGPPTVVLARFVLLAGIVLRFLYLDADPHYYEWWGYVTDEGRWVTHARELVLFGQVRAVDWTLHLMLAPVFQGISYVTFKLLGVSIFSARLFSALCGSGLLVVAWMLLRRLATPPALLLAMVVLAFAPDLLVLSRVAVPEIAVMSVHLVVYAVLMSDDLGRRRLVLGGVLEALAVGVKATALPVAGIWLLVIAARRISEGSPRRAVPGILWYLIGFAAPAVLVGIAAASCCLRDLSGILSNARVLPTFMAPSNPKAALAFFFEDSLSTSFGLWGLGVWLATVGRLVASRDAVSARRRRYFVSSLLWFASYTVLMVSLSYFPSRYKTHVLVPGAVCLAVGMTLLYESGALRLGVAGAGYHPAARVVLAAWLALPTAVVLTPGLTDLVALGGEDPGRLRAKIACLAAALGAVTWATLRRSFGAGTVRILLFFPVIVCLAWLALREVSWASFWHGGDPGRAVWQWSLAIGVAVAAVAAGRAIGWIITADRMIVGLGVVYLVFSLVRIAPGYLQPRYTIRETSAALGRVLSAVPDAVGTIDGEGLFSENRVHYASIRKRTLGSARPGALVIVGEIKDPTNVLGREYRIVARYPIYVAPEYFLTGSDPAIPPGGGLVATVWLRRSPDETGNVDGGPQGTVALPGGVLRLNFIHAARPRTANPPSWIPYDGSRSPHGAGTAGWKMSPTIPAAARIVDWTRRSSPTAPPRRHDGWAARSCRAGKAVTERTSRGFSVSTCPMAAIVSPASPSIPVRRCPSSTCAASNADRTMRCSPDPATAHLCGRSSPICSFRWKTAVARCPQRSP